MSGLAVSCQRALAINKLHLQIGAAWLACLSVLCKPEPQACRASWGWWCRQKEAERQREDALKREREAQKQLQRKQAYQQVGLRL